MLPISNKTAIGIGLSIAIVVMISHALEVPFSLEATSLQSDSLHIPGFGLVTVCFILLLRTKYSPATAYRAAFLISISLAILSEATQVFGQRDAELSDLGRDLMGIMIALALTAIFDRSTRRSFTNRRFWLIIAAGITAMVLSVAPFAYERYAHSRRAAAMPFLISFDSLWERSFFDAYGGAEVEIVPTPIGWPNSRSNALQISFSSNLYSGIEISPHPDWSEYGSFSFWAASADDQEHQVNIRIHDKWHNWREDDRFNRRVLVGPIPTQYEVSLKEVAASTVAREFDFSQVASFIMYKAHASGNEKIIVDDIRLHRR